MVFIFSKLFWELLRPSTFLLLLGLVGSGLLWTRFWRTGRTLTIIALVLFALPALLPLNALLARPLENAYPPVPLPRTLTGILVLGGAEMPKTSVARGQLSLRDGAERVLAGLELARRYPEARLAFSGVTASLYDSRSEAHVTRDLFRTFGLAQARLVIEAKSRNTEENVRFSRALIDPQPGDTWVVVTSAIHMPRTLGLFAKANWPVLPYPVDYQTNGTLTLTPTLRFAESLYTLEGTLREWIGLLSYRLLGRTDALFPRLEHP